jgi:hypothetical protein
MRQRGIRALGAVATTCALLGSSATGAAPAGAVEFGPHQPSLTVVCSAPHHGNYFSAARFAQHGRWAANGKVRITITPVTRAAPETVLHTRTGPHGWFHIRRTLNGDQHPKWVAGASYTWTTEVSGRSWAMARRGTVTLTGSC